MQLADLIKIVNEGYPDGMVGQAFEQLQAKKKHIDVGDTLASFVAIELKETFDENATDQAQIAEAIRVMDNAADELHGVINALYRYHPKTKATKEG